MKKDQQLLNENLQVNDLVKDSSENDSIAKESLLERIDMWIYKLGEMIL